MAKPQFISLGRGIEIPIIYEDRAVLAIDKPAGWMLAPSEWDRTGRNLQLAIASSIHGGEFWARSRNLKFLRFIHRLDAETTGVLLFARSSGAVSVYSRLFESRLVLKTYLAVVEGTPPADSWTARGCIGEDPGKPGRMRIDPREGKEAETEFVVAGRREGLSLIRAHPKTGRTHQIRVHLLDSGLKIMGDPLYGTISRNRSPDFPMALRAASLAFRDPFNRRQVEINAPMKTFRAQFGFPETEPESGR